MRKLLILLLNSITFEETLIFLLNLINLIEGLKKFNFLNNNIIKEEKLQFLASVYVIMSVCTSLYLFFRGFHFIYVYFRFPTLQIALFIFFLNVGLMISS